MRTFALLLVLVAAWQDKPGKTPKPTPTPAPTPAPKPVLWTADWEAARREAGARNIPIFVYLSSG